MARPKAFNKDEALDAAIGVFREHGFAGTSAGMLTEAMKIGRQSLYDTFHDKWDLYRAAVQRYAETEVQAHLATLRSQARARDGIQRLIARVVADAHTPCLGVGSICEFGHGRADLTQIHHASARVLEDALTARIQEAQADGDIAPDLDPKHVAGFVSANIAGIRIAARSGASAGDLQALGNLALRVLA
ncbi:TetR/AcrR family transcriptional regulator [Cupriavidus sp. 2KB_3]|uniref:TetR/AcrR family transcriptional regulator n=1 Tax=Cupriavidus TaxID=106589 RepID=UPI0011EFB820|nr:TetR/AcrR family transcriptional regulator [Cupriavidus campinensis]